MWWNVHLVSHMIDYAQKRRTAGCCCVVSCILLLFTLWQLLVSWWHCVEPCLRGVWCTFMFLFFCCFFFFFFSLQAHCHCKVTEHSVLKCFFATRAGQKQQLCQNVDTVVRGVQVKAFLRKGKSIWPAIRAEPPACGCSSVWLHSSLV